MKTTTEKPNFAEPMLVAVMHYAAELLMKDGYSRGLAELIVMDVRHRAFKENYPEAYKESYPQPVQKES